MVVITRSDLPNKHQYQLPQTSHVVAEFAYEYPNIFKQWKEESNSIIVLETKDELELKKLKDSLSKLTSVSEFREPDINNELTAIACYCDESIRKKLQSLPLAGKSKLIGDLIYDMSITPQTNSQSVLEHGLSVHKYYLDLVEKLKGGQSTLEWKLPEWLLENSEFILKNTYKLDIMRDYQIYHDCGKPYCLEMDADGKRHYPDHANVSYNTYLEYFNNQTVANLIKGDMDLHLLKPSGVEEWVKGKDTKYILSLLITSLCELHSNANMFGPEGIESVNFKIKYKNFDKIGKNIIKLLNEKK